MGSQVSDELKIENGIPQGGAINPVLFNIMINGIFMNLDRRIGSALDADYGEIWTREGDNTIVMTKIKQAVRNVEDWSYNWGFKLSLSKSCFMTITNKKKIDAQNIELHGKSMEKVEKF